ncbi:Uncharacterised protein [Mycobacteroides abscessus]|nr:Uncharacterised protein [Mycobacteroides abscessus]
MRGVIRIYLRSIKFKVSGGEATVLWWRACADVNGAPTLAVNVLGHIGEQCEMGEGPDDGDGLVDVDAVEQLCQLGTVDLRSAHPE